MEIKDELLDRIAELEVQALLEGLEDPEVRLNPSFLDKVRKFLQQNNLRTSPEATGVKRLQQVSSEIIPTFDFGAQKQS